MLLDSKRRVYIGRCLSFTCIGHRP